MDSFAGYQILETLVTGTLPEVYLAQKGDGSPVHLKVFRREGRSGDETLRIKRDLEALRKIEHARIMPVLESGSQDDALWYVVPVPQGHSLEHELETRSQTSRDGFALNEVLQIAIGLAEALGYLHENGLVHGHLDASNIYLTPVMGLVLGDSFPGLATGKAATEEVAGLRYASPEQIQLDSVRPPSDVYQAGLLLYHFLSGRLPLEDENPFQTVLRRMQEEIPPPSRTRSGCPEELDRIILKCLRPAAEDRYPDMNEFLSDVLRLDPVSGVLLPGAEMVGDVEEEMDPFAGLLIPGERKPQVLEPASAASALIPGALAGLLIIALVLYLLR